MIVSVHVAVVTGVQGLHLHPLLALLPPPFPRRPSPHPSPLSPVFPACPVAGILSQSLADSKSLLVNCWADSDIRFMQADVVNPKPAHAIRPDSNKEEVGFMLKPVQKHSTITASVADQVTCASPDVVQNVIGCQKSHLL